MTHDYIVIGGGLYGCIAALELDRLGLRTVILEAKADLLQRASYVNQARVHQGYHYPRSLLTGLRSRENFRAFTEEFSGCIDSSFDKYYAIARNFSKITAAQFVQFCGRIGAPVEPASDEIASLFAPQHVEAVFKVREYAFDAVKLKNILLKRLQESSVEVKLNTPVEEITRSPDGYSVSGCSAPKILNCTYSGLNRLQHLAGAEVLPMKHEYTELALVEVPEPLLHVGVTMMDGPFFSCMPFPARALHTLSHVRYTPHYQTVDRPGEAPVDLDADLARRAAETSVRRMILDASRFIPSLAEARYVDSLWEIKTVLPQSEGNDSRPILFREANKAPGFYSILGGKIDNIADLREEVRAHFGHAPASYGTAS